MPTITLCNPAEQIARLRPLLVENWAETGFGFPFDPSAEAYGLLYEAGVVFGVLAEEAGEPVGYCSVTVARHPHNPAVIIGANDALFVVPSHRGRSTAARIIRTAEDEARRRGASYFSWHCRAGTGLAETLERHGYRPADIVVMKGL